MEIFRRIDDFVGRYSLLSNRDKVLLAISGGPDSVFLLHYLLKKLQENQIKFLQCIYIDHGLRPEEVNNEKIFLKEITSKYSLPFIIKKINLKIKKGNLQETARNLRYKILKETAKKYGINKIALAHTASDNAETVLMRLLRGTGIKGLSGIPVRKEIKNGLFIIRPLLKVYKEELIEYLKRNRLFYCLDSSNLKKGYFRNKVRLRLIPYIVKNFSLHFIKNLNTLSEIASEENNYLESKVEKLYNKYVRQINNEISVDFGSLFKYNNTILRRILLRVLKEKVSFKKIDEIIKFCQTGSSKTLTISKLLKARKKGNLLVLFTEESKKKNYKIKIKTPGITIKNGFKIVTDITSKPHPQWKRSLYIGCFDADRINASDLYIRNRRKGDIFYPFGLKGKKKLKKFFIDEKIPFIERDNIPLFVNNKDILWVIGVRQSEKAKLTKKTKRILCVEVRKFTKGEKDENYRVSGKGVS